MTTRDHIERITDEGLFERLCISIIRNLKPELSGILETGTNAQGRTIPAPLDGFVQVDQNRFVSIHHTTIGKSKLKSKWLGKGEDLEKTAGEMSGLREKFPSGKFEIILTTTHVPNIKLQKEVIEKADELGLIVEFLDQSIIADFLDNNASGQWLRRQYLQIDYVLLSKEALLDISDQDLNNYRNNFYLPQVDQMIQRPIETFPKSGIQPIVGKQGYGKSAFSLQLAKVAEKEGRLIVWIDPQHISEVHSFEELLRNKLRKLVPNLYLDSRDMWYNSELWKNTVFIVDDLNRIDNSDEVLRKIVQWNSDSFLKKWGLMFIIPLWEDTFDRNFGVQEILNQPIYLQKYSLSESRKILEASIKKVDSSVDLFNIDRIAHELGYDPLLIDLFNKLIGSKQFSDFQEIPQNIIQKYIESTIGSLANDSSDTLLTEFSDSLRFLGNEMLERKVLFPAYKDIKLWFKDHPELLKAFKLITKDGKLLSINAETGQLAFRHDRVKDEVLSECMSNSFLNYSGDWRFSELYYGRYIGKFLASEALDETILRWFLEFNPIALFEAIRISPRSMLTKENVDHISSWIKTDLETELMSNVRERIKSLLLYSDSEGIVPLVESFKSWDRTLVLAGMKNGSLKAAITFFYHFLRFGMSSLEHLCFERFKSNHKNLVKTLIESLSKEDVSDRITGILRIYANIKNEELIQSIIELWDRFSGSKVEIFSSLSRAFFSCGGELNSSFSQTLVNYYELNHRSIKNHPSLVDLPWSDSEIDFLIKKCKEDEAWARLFYSSLYTNGSFKAVKYNIEKYSEELNHINVDKILTKDHYEAQSLYDYSRQWNSGSNGKTLTTESTAYLRSVFQNESESNLKRWFAFEVWENSLKDDDLELLKEVDQSSFLFPKAFKHRVWLGDNDCVPQFSDQLKNNPSLIFHSSRIWCNEVKSELRSILKGLKTDRFLNSSKIDGFSRFSYLFYEIPLADAEDLLKENWPNVRLISEFIKICLYLDSQELNDLAYDSISKIEEKSQIFDSISWTFQSNVEGKSQFLKVDKLERLKPFLEYIPETEIHFLIDPNNKETFEWWRDNVTDSYKSFGGRCYFPDDDNIKRDFQRLSKEKEDSLSLDYFIEDLVKFGTSNQRILRNLGEWLQNKKDIKIDEFKLACHVVFMIGNRRDLDFLRKWIDKVDGDHSIYLKAAEDGVCIHSLI